MSVALAYEGCFPLPNLAGRDIGPFLRVKRDADGQIQLATNADTDIDKECGLCASQIFGSVDDIASVEPLVPGKVYRVVAAEAFAVNAILYRATNGRVKDTADGSQWGIAMEAASGAGSQVIAQFLPKRS
jgi:hypothetical protein